jgi:hypothetical protein
MIDTVANEQQMMRGKSADWCYIFQERLGILCGDRPATFAYLFMAKQEADDSFKRKTV